MTAMTPYDTSKLAAFFKDNRQSWDQFYPSERWLFSEIAKENGGRFGHVLDVGCAAGGLGRALHQQFGYDSYTGVDISAPAIETGLAMAGLPENASLSCSDILKADGLGRADYDMVISLSCADWNTETNAIIDRCWDLVAPGGRFIISLRLTPGRSLTSMQESYQYLSFTDGPDQETKETVPYVVFNIVDALALLTSLPNAGDLLAYGYWGPVSATARTQIDRAVFTVISMTKGSNGTSARLDLRLPHDIWRTP